MHGEGVHKMYIVQQGVENVIFAYVTYGRPSGGSRIFCLVGATLQSRGMKAALLIQSYKYLGYCACHNYKFVLGSPLSSLAICTSIQKTRMSNYYTGQI